MTNLRETGARAPWIPILVWLAVVACILLALFGCVGVSDISVDKVEPVCARQCTASYSACVATPSIGAPTALFYQCKEALKLCVSTCPAK